MACLLGPILSPATTYVVLLEILLETLPPLSSMLFLSSVLETCVKTPETTKEPEPKAVKEDDPWVEDEEGNFVRQSELNQQEQNERVSKPTSKNKQPKKK